jgi:hypothetical protein
MWSTETLWFDTAVVLGIFAVGNVLLGHFEAHKPKWKRIFKLVVFLAVVVAVSAGLGRVWAVGLLGIALSGAAYIHLVWLPRNGIDGWTGEPRQRYHELIGYEAPPGPGSPAMHGPPRARTAAGPHPPRTESGTTSL